MLDPNSKADNFADHAFDRVKSLHIAVRRERSQNWSATVPQTPAGILNEAIVTGMIVLCWVLAGWSQNRKVRARAKI